MHCDLPRAGMVRGFEPAVISKIVTDLKDHGAPSTADWGRCIILVQISFWLVIDRERERAVWVGPEPSLVDSVHPPWHCGGGWTESAQPQPTQFRLPACSSTHSARCAFQEAVCPLIWTARPLHSVYCFGATAKAVPTTGSDLSKSGSWPRSMRAMMSWILISSKGRVISCSVVCPGK